MICAQIFIAMTMEMAVMNLELMLTHKNDHEQWGSWGGIPHLLMMTTNVCSELMYFLLIYKYALITKKAGWDLQTS